MATYVIVRYGSNAANQSMCNRAVLGTVEAKSREEAEEIAPHELAATVYNNQHLEAFPYSRANKADREAAEEATVFAADHRRYLAALEREALDYSEAHELESLDRARLETLGR